VFPADRQEQIRSMLAGSLQGVVSQLLLRTSDGMGRVVALEIMHCTAAIRNLIRDKKVFQIPSIIETSRSLGMVTLEQSLRDLLSIRRVTVDEALRKARDLESLELLLKEQGAMSQMSAVEYDMRR
jgi:twitching motility protein PilT